MNSVKKILISTLLLTATTQLICEDSWYLRFTNWASSVFGWARQNPGKTALAVSATGIACYLYKQSCDQAKRKQEITTTMNEIIGSSFKTEQFHGESSYLLSEEDQRVIRNNIDFQLQIDDLLSTKFRNSNPPIGGFDYNSEDGKGEKNLNYLLIVAQNLPGIQRLADNINVIINRAHNRYNKLLTDQENQLVESKATALFSIIQGLRNPEISIHEFQPSQSCKKQVRFTQPPSKTEEKEEE